MTNSEALSPGGVVYTAPQAAKVLGIRRQSVWHAIRRGAVGAYRLGGTYYIPHDEFEAWRVARAARAAKRAGGAR